MTIYWLMVSAPTYLEDLPRWFLGDIEAKLYAALKTPKRRRDWLLGRVLGEMPQVLTQESGAPLVKGYPNLSLSISHCEDHAFCTATWKGSVGADIKRIAARSEAFVDDYFAPREIEAVKRIPQSCHDLDLEREGSCAEGGFNG
jgi:4'-phosphopantetheinyl transferase EntD